MSISFSEFDQFKLNTEFGEGYYKHTTACESSTEGEIRAEIWSRDISIGNGRLGVVWLEKQEKGELRAVKQIPKMHVSSAREYLLALTKLSMYPEHFVQLLGWFENEESVYVAMEYTPCGNLASLIADGMVESDVKIVTAQLLKGLEIMHKNGICHHNLKPQNILLVSSSPLMVKTSDFGMSKQTGNDTIPQTAVETPYTAAAVLEAPDYPLCRASTYTSADDIWSLGNLIYTMLTKESPFLGRPKLLDLTLITASFLRKRLTEKKASPSAIKFIASLMVLRPESRLTAEEALNDPWLNNKQIKEEGEDNSWPVKQVVETGFKLQDDSTLSTEANAIAKNTLQIAANYEQKAETPVLENRANISEDQSYTPLVWAAMRGEEDTVQMLLDSGTDITVKCGALLQTALHKASSQGHQGVTKLLLERGADVLEKSGDGHTALHLAAQGGHQEIVKLLLGKGADILEKSGDGYTAIYLAVKGGHQEVVKLLLERGADVLERTEQGHTVLYLAAFHGHREIVSILLQKGADISAKCGSSNRTALHVAARSGWPQVVKILLENGADILEKDRLGKTALFIAAEHGYKDPVKVLLEWGADITVRCSTLLFTALHAAASWGRDAVVEILLEHGADVLEIDGAGNSYTALYIAARHGYEDVVKTLLKRGAVTTSKSTPDLWAPLHTATYHGHLGVVKALLDQGSNVLEKTGDGLTALYIAAQNGHKDIVKLLLERGSAIKEKHRPKLWTSLHIAAKNGHEGVVTILLKYGADVLEKTKAGYTALYIAAELGHKNVAKVLLENGADTTAPPSMWAPLHVAAFSGHEDVVEILLDQGADVLEKEGTGVTALHMAAQNGHEGVAKLLLNRGVDVMTRTKDGETALHIAAQYGHGGIVKMLLGRGAKIDAKYGTKLKTPLHTAVYYGNEGVAKILLEEGADILEKTGSGATVLHIVVKNKNKNAERQEDLASFLIASGAKLNEKNKRGKTSLRLAIELDHEDLVQLLKKELGMIAPISDWRRFSAQRL